MAIAAHWHEARDWNDEDEDDDYEDDDYEDEDDDVTQEEKEEAVDVFGHDLELSL
ncbi:hypothetical protein FE257_009468 [Aspergillus nanangensis]|uniref:Uncharacterized protein n=1 Tax=Aspergillus nanangensis TaxID=2582783 RepID=A0AAD4CJZ6_ASPNN|nr:hypothetical protein FE257_009468 [Aspergillus nanangensis]